MLGIADFKQLLVILVPSVCLAVLIGAALIFAYLAIRSRQPLYVSTLAIIVNSLLFIASELCILLFGGLLRDWPTSIQFHRLEQLAGLWFLATIPLFVALNLPAGGRLRKIELAATAVGAAVAFVITVVAFIEPNLFVSVTEHEASWLSVQFDFGRGREGVLYTLRDVLVGVQMLLGMTLLASGLSARESRVTVAIVLAGLAGASFLVASDVIYVYTGWHIDPLGAFSFSRMPVGVTFFVACGFFAVLRQFLDQKDELAQAVGALQESERTLNESNEAMSRFVPNEFITYLGKSGISEVSLGDCTKMDMTILFADIRDFTHLSEGMTPEQNFAFINAFLRHMVPVIRDYDGFVDKFIGDAIMALFPGGPDDAVRAAVAMQKELAVYNASLGEGHGKVGMGIGIHSGTLMMGTVGDKYRMEGTVISSAVNLASRVESLTKIYRAGILMSEESFRILTDPTRHSFRFIGQARVKGASAPLSIFEVYEGDLPSTVALKTSTHSEFEKGVISVYTGKLVEAEGRFKSVVLANPEDGAAKYYLGWLAKRQAARQDLAPGDERSAFRQAPGSAAASPAP